MSRSTTEIFPSKGDELKIEFNEGFTAEWMVISYGNAQIIIYRPDQIDFKNKVLWAYETWRRNYAATRRLASRHLVNSDDNDV